MTENSEARERVLDAAERLFAERGYKHVTLRDIAAEIGIQHTSLYHHAPGGKERLFIEVMERNFKRHEAGLTGAVAEGASLRQQLYRVADWLLSQSPMDLSRMTHADLRSINPAEAERLSEVAYESLMLPIYRALAAAEARGEIAHPDLMLMAGAIMGMIESFFAIPDADVQGSRAAMAYLVVDTLLDGMIPR
jgi:AcrR family transcriptional regulator